MRVWRAANAEKLKQEASARWAATLQDPKLLAKHREENNRHYASLTESEKKARQESQRPAGRRYKEANKERLRLKRAERAKDPEFIAKNREASNRYYRSLTREERKAISSEKASYLKQYRAENAERLKRLFAERYIAKREEIREYEKKRYASNPQPYKVRAMARHAADPKAVAERAIKWAKENPKLRKLQVKKSGHKRRALINGAGGTVTTKQLRDLFKRQGGKCAGCKKRLGKFEETKKWEHDHVMPIALGGANTIENAQILCKSCNCRKHAKHPDRWAAELGRLFA
jgi:5-methylcytosine-specific restriction endonuclease McrA